ncbi:hypothetical protein F7984_05205 [Pradoshia sp. D12]|uniref:hypothetical protein n=1 Tax=Bacillaceae TaxID=186817 RepID=UPI00080AF14A|nr:MULTISPECIES: hypothetical protein [Bacillaceae]OCA89915.1 hypothetical protein A8L44_03005 [Bacillus sp. FJAT-27986]QFK70680.1 hypothetical protein F7984_05205 [Pradoshia sp. D12]TPF72475.1 hypothetical protein FHY44_01600 [Bacillus sp. D12]
MNTIQHYFLIFRLILFSPFYWIAAGITRILSWICQFIAYFPMIYIVLIWLITIIGAIYERSFSIEMLMEGILISAIVYFILSIFSGLINIVLNAFFTVFLSISNIFAKLSGRTIETI